MDSKKLRASRDALRRIAERGGEDAESVYESVRAAIAAGLADPRESVQARWRGIPRDGAVPMPEELIAYLAEEARRRTVSGAECDILD